jgi:hypothetical protein
VLLTRSPLSPEPKLRFSLDLHVLSAPPAFVLSQDQTLREEIDFRQDREASDPRRGAAERPSMRRKLFTSSLSSKVTSSTSAPPAKPAKRRHGIANDASDATRFTSGRLARSETLPVSTSCTLLSFQRPGRRAGDKKASDSRQRPSGRYTSGRIRSLEGAPVVE